RSFVHSTPALSLIVEKMPATLELAVGAMLIAIVVGIPLGLWAGLRPTALPGRAIMAGSVLRFSLPSLWLGLVLIRVCSGEPGWLPANGGGASVDVLGAPASCLAVDGLAHLALPATNLALFNVALLSRLTRSGAHEALLQDYVKFARTKGRS